MRRYTDCPNILKDFLTYHETIKAHSRRTVDEYFLDLRNFFRYLKDRGLKGVKLVISDKASGLVDVLGDFFPAAQWQRCVVHWYRNAEVFREWL